MEKLAKLVKKLITKIDSNDKQYSISFIVDRSLRIPALRSLLINELSDVKEYIELFYIVYFLLKGDSYEVAEFKSKNDLYYLSLEEIGDSDYIDIECEDCYGDGNMDCGECDGEGTEVCHECDGEGRVDSEDESDNECDWCYGEGELECNYCDHGKIECDYCEGDGYQQSENEYVDLNTEFWIYYGEDINREINDEMAKNDYEIIDIYDILDNAKNRGSVYLVRTENQSDQIEMDDFIDSYGDYDEVKGKHKVTGNHQLNDVPYNSFRILNTGKSYKIG